MKNLEGKESCSLLCSLIVFGQLQQLFPTSDAERGVRRPGLSPRLPQTSWVTQGRSRPLLAFIFSSDKQSLKKIYFGFLKKYKTKQKIQVPRNGFCFGFFFLNYIYFMTNTKSNVKTSLAGGLVYSSPLWTLSCLLMKHVLMAVVEEGLQRPS